MSWYRDNISENPMMAEIGRFKQMAMGRTLGSIGLRAVLLFAILIAGFICWIALNSRGQTPPGIAILGQLIFCSVAVPLRFYGVIAGERERRSWELLRVAPITNSQIVVGKLAGMAAMITVIHLIFFVPFLLLLLAQFNPNLRYGGAYPYYDIPEPAYMMMFGAQAFSYFLSLMIASLTLFFSARSKRAFTALALTLGSLLVVFFILPMLLSSLFRDDFLAFALNPFASGYYLAFENYGFDQEGSGLHKAGVLASFIMVVFLTGVFVVYAAKTLSFADNLVKFIPRKQHHA